MSMQLLPPELRDSIPGELTHSVINLQDLYRARKISMSQLMFKIRQLYSTWLESF